MLIRGSFHSPSHPDIARIYVKADSSAWGMSYPFLAIMYDFDPDYWLRQFDSGNLRNPLVFDCRVQTCLTGEHRVAYTRPKRIEADVATEENSDGSDSESLSSCNQTCSSLVPACTKPVSGTTIGPNTTGSIDSCNCHSYRTLCARALLILRY